MSILRVRSGTLWTGAALSAGSFVLYLFTLAPTLTWGWHEKGMDGGEFLAAANTLGIPHPPGYPTYTLLLRSFATLVPVGDFAFRGNLLSAVLASASVLVLYLATLRLCRWLKPDGPAWLGTASAALGAAAFGASPLLWSQAVITEVYTLNALFAGALLLVASHLAIPPPSDQSGPMASDRKLALFGFLLGIGLGNHLTLLAVAAPLLYWLWKALGWRRLASPWIIGAFLLGISVYAYLPIRASQHPPVNWGNAETFKGVFWMLTARPYQDYVFGVAPGTIPTRLVSWLELVFSQFNPLGLFFGLIGARALLLRASPLFLGTLASILVISVYSVTYNTIDFEVLMLPAFFLFSAWTGFGFYWITSSWIEAPGDSRGISLMGRVRVNPERQVMIVSALAFLLLPAVSIALNYGSQDLSDDYRAQDHARAIVDAVPDGSVVLSSEEKTVFSLWYMRYVEKPDWNVAVIAVPLLQFDWYLRDIHRMFPDRVPLIAASDLERTITRIVEHNDGSSRVYFTYRNSFLAESFDLTPQAEGAVYEARPR